MARDPTMLKFDDATIERLFGAEDAENEDHERFKEYFFFNKTYDNLLADLPIRILVGHKGIGKSALLRRAYLQNEENAQLAIWIRPNDLVPYIADTSSPALNILIENWKSGLLAAIVDKVLSRFPDTKFDKKDLARSTTKAALSIIGKAAKDKLPSVSDLLTRKIVENYLKDAKIFVYIDDIDRGWTASPAGIRSISALLNAIRDLAGSETQLMFRIGLRSDVYYLVRTSDESTDKIERNVIWLSWTEHEILAVMARRIETFFDTGRNQDEITNLSQFAISTSIFSQVMKPFFQGRGHWSNRPIHNVLVSLTRKRPRDLVKLMHGAARNAHLNDHQVIDSHDLESTFESYSSERLQDIINEFRSEMPNIEPLLFGMRPTKKGRRTSENYLYRTDQLVGKLNGIMSQSNLTFTNGKRVSAKSLIQFLYKIDFIIARKDLENRIDRKYFDQNRFLASEFVDFGYDWEVHPAYRWALQPQDVRDLLAQIKI